MSRGNVQGYEYFRGRNRDRGRDRGRDRLPWPKPCAVTEAESVAESVAVTVCRSRMERACDTGNCMPDLHRYLGYNKFTCQENI